MDGFGNTINLVYILLFIPMETTERRGKDWFVLAVLLFLGAEMSAPVAEYTIADQHLVLAPFLTGIVKINIDWEHVYFLVLFFRKSFYIIVLLTDGFEPSKRRKDTSFFFIIRNETENK